MERTGVFEANGADNGRVQLELLDERRFTSGFVHLHYRVST